MDYLSFLFTLFLLFIVLPDVVQGKPLVPALFIFGDSLVDVGNNNYLSTLVKANLPPYGRDFVNHHPSGRFSNEKLTIDYACILLSLISKILTISWMKLLNYISSSFFSSI